MSCGFIEKWFVLVFGAHKLLSCAKDMILATRWTAKGRTKEPQEDSKGVRALIDAGVETSTSIITHLKVRVCAPGGIGGQAIIGGGMISTKHSAITLKSPGAVRIYLPKCSCVLKYKALRS
jgi:hypothetical protein